MNNGVCRNVGWTVGEESKGKERECVKLPKGKAKTETKTLFETKKETGFHLSDHAVLLKETVYRWLNNSKATALSQWRNQMITVWPTEAWRFTRVLRISFIRNFRFLNFQNPPIFFFFVYWE